MRFFENSMWQSGRLGFEVPDPKTKESKASDIYVTVCFVYKTRITVLSPPQGNFGATQLSFHYSVSFRSFAAFSSDSNALLYPFANAAKMAGMRVVLYLLH